MRPTFILSVTLLALPFALAQDKAKKYPTPKSLGDVETYGKNIQRTMTLLATSTAKKRNQVRILFYGQSITEQSWAKLVADDLRKRFPHADLVTENRAIGGFASQLLVKTAETDLYPFYPDLVVFHVYGSHVEYENILKGIRERTTAEVLQQADHLSARDTLDEETDPAKLTPKQWNQWMNANFLPSMAKKYGTELVAQRDLWKRYLKDHSLAPKDLLRDGVHLNDHGCYLMAEIVKAHLRHRPKDEDAAWKGRVKTYVVGKDIAWKDGKLTLDFEGNRVEAVCKPGEAPAAEVRIDGKRPSAFEGAYALTRTTSYPGSKWPVLLKVGATKPRVVEDWTLTITEIDKELKTFRFKVAGSKTGADGEGEGGKRFVSKSGRVVIEPDDWNLQYALRVFKKPIAAPFVVRWKVVPLFVDTFVSPGVKDATRETTVTLAQGIANGKHKLEITGTRKTPIAAIRVSRPEPVKE